ncbi:MAG: L-histidine N(alpha)-methyltransferase [Candidatus Abyssobacteria bacterium SURF_5]|uniref:L-histidine N(Alpha)-methyltransferase n=1 Tax=Abyssobacteria bacterium (strain SURF_5) TaxID=2093360 RepID=A0A3A4NKW8_ABYX5|nr:MAG: L-histidine N(alpha)-methyltransferase [Candidatus Abyssubacteria bacterium SURF_5]
MRSQADPSKINELPACVAIALNGGDSAIIDAAEEANPVLDFAHSAARTLSENPKWMECRFLYDARGSALFEQICRQPEYYPTRRETAILHRYAGEICETTGCVTLAELGCGSAIKTRHILSAYVKSNGSVRYVPVDVSRSALQHACAAITAWHPAVKVAGIRGTYECAFPFLKALSPVMVLFLGSTIGNLNEDQDRLFWRNIGRHLSEGDFFLLGVDLVKDTSILEAAYNDRAGVSAAFTLNLFERMNRELKTGIDVLHLQHVAYFSSAKSRIEIFAQFNREQRVRIKPLNKSIPISAGERIQVEISRKFNLNELVPRLYSCGFATRRIFSDENSWFALLLLEKVAND